MKHKNTPTPCLTINAWGSLMLLLSLIPTSSWAQTPTQLTFEIVAQPSFAANVPAHGRLFVIINSNAEREPRFGVGWADPKADPFFAKDISGWNGKTVLTLGEEAVGFPLAAINKLTPGTYYAQALYDIDTTFSYINAPGNFYSAPMQIEVAAGRSQRFRLTLDQRIPAEQLPQDTEHIKYVRVQSRLLTEFWKQPMYLRAAIILPKGYAQEPQRRYPVRYKIGGYHARYTNAERMMREGSALQRAWFSEECPRMLLVHLDGEAPFGDSYQMNSANNGPYGDATVQELMPYIEQNFRGLATPESRFLEGGSTGGWVALALQIFYPEFFNGAWSFCADGVDFRYFQLVNIYSDDNAFVNEHGYERPSMRDTDGEPRFSMRHEITMERVLGRGNTFVTSGGQWGAWNAVYGPRAANGWPAALWDSWTGKIDHKIAAAWRPYDLREKLEKNWATLGPKLQGKLHIWMGDMDSFYLNNAMRLLEKFLKATQNPKSDARFVFAPGEGHCWQGISEIEMMREMEMTMSQKR